MKRLIIICEGATEQAFCNDVLRDYFLTKDILIEAPTIKHSNGGIVAWDTLKKQIIKHLNEGIVPFPCWWIITASVTLIISLDGWKARE